MAEVNEEKQRAIATYKTPGTYLILAGPGTGKTTTITERIQAMLEDGISEEKILCLTFTDAAAREMKERICNKLKKIDINVNISTFHSFCLDLIRNNPDEFSLKENFNILNDAFSRVIIKECMEDDRINPLLKAYRDEKNNFYKFISEIKDCIDELKQYRYKKEDEKLFKNNLKHNPLWGVRKKELEQEEEQRKLNNKSLNNEQQKDFDTLNTKIAQMEELWEIYKLYLEKTEERNLIDFSDMINIVLDKFEKDSAFLSKVANEYEYIMVDEYQDTNASQNEIVIKLAEAQERKNIFVVGDDDQIIYTFQGASLDTINNFKEKFSKTDGFEEIKLKKNFRSIQDILELGHEVVTNPDNAGRIKKDKLNAENDSEIIKNHPAKKGVRFLNFEQTNFEYDYIVNEIDDLVHSDNCPVNSETKEKKLSEIAILVRSHKEIGEIARLLRNRNIPVQTSGGKNIFEIPSVIVLFLYMQFLANPLKYENKFFELLLMKPFCIHPKDYDRLNKMRTNYTALFNPQMIQDMEKLLGTPKEGVKSEFNNYSTMKDFISSYKEIREILNKENIKDTILTIGTKSGIFKEFITGKSKTIENIEGILKLIDEADVFSQMDSPCDFCNFVEYLNRCLNDNILIKTDKTDKTYNAVQILTLHDSKGKEFEYVYMPSLVRSKWESSSKSNKPKIPTGLFKDNETFDEADARYSSYKRSEQVRLMYVGMTRAKHSLTLSYAKPPGTKWQTDPSKYIAQYFNDKTFVKYDKLDADINALIKFDYNDEKELKAYIDSVLASKPFSSSSLNTYLECPQKFLFNFIFDLKVRDGNFDYINLGLAVHTAYQKTVGQARLNNHEYPDENEFQRLFEEDMKNRVFSTREVQKNFFAKWIKNRGNAYKHLHDYPENDLKDPEYKFELKIGNENFSCTIDRIPKIGDKYYIHDYKTGERPDCLDTLKKNSLNYYRQLALYKYALEKKENVKIEDAVLIYPFAEDISKIELPLLLDEKECQEVVDIFLSAIKNIREHKFRVEKTDYYTCKKCSYKEICNYYTDKD